MGELKDLREQSETLVNRAKELGNKLYLACLLYTSPSPRDRG